MVVIDTKNRRLSKLCGIIAVKNFVTKIAHRTEKLVPEETGEKDIFFTI